MWVRSRWTMFSTGECDTIRLEWEKRWPKLKAYAYATARRARVEGMDVEDVAAQLLLVDVLQAAPNIPDVGMVEARCVAEVARIAQRHQCEEAHTARCHRAAIIRCDGAY